MINLDRLKGTGLLMQGFDEFMANWMAGEEPNPETINWDSPEWKYAKQLPPEIRLFYEVVHKWPTARMKQIDSKKEFLEFPPKPRNMWEPDKREISLIAGRKDRWEIWYSTKNPAGEITLSYSNLGRVTKANPLEQAMEVPIEELLITFGLNALIANSHYFDCRRQNFFAEAALLFNGRYHMDSPRHVLFHSDGYLWFGWGAYDESLVRNDSSTHWCIRRRKGTGKL